MWPFTKQNPHDFLPIQQEDNQQQQQQQTPQYVPVETFNAAMQEIRNLGQRFEGFSTTLETVFSGGNRQQQQQTRQRPQEPEIPDITDEEYNDALLHGDANKVGIRMKAMALRAAREAAAPLQARINDLEQQGMGILDQVTTELTQASLEKMPYYSLVKSDVDAMLSSMPAHQRTPLMREHCYNTVVGQNVDKIMTFKQAEAQRLAQQDTKMPGRAIQASDEKPTAQTVFGDVVKAGATWHGSGQLWGKRSPNEWAKSRYGVETIDQAAVYASNVLAVDDCPNCFSPVVGGKCHCRKAA